MTRSGFGTATITRSNPASWSRPAFLKGERAYFEDLVSTYGKTFHDRDDFPYRIPQLMMGFTQDAQLDEALVEARDRRFGVSQRQRRACRADIPTPSLIPGANSWEPEPPSRAAVRRSQLKDARDNEPETGGSPARIRAEPIPSTRVYCWNFREIGAFCGDFGEPGECLVP